MIIVTSLIWAVIFLVHYVQINHHLLDPFHSITLEIQLLKFILVFLLISVLFHYFKIRIDFGTGILTLLLTYDFVMIYESLLKNRIKFLQRYKRNPIGKGTFS